MAANEITSAITREEFRDCDSDGRVHPYYPAEGFGCLYHRTMLNDFFTDLMSRSNIRTVAEIPLDSYGVVGAGSLVFAQLRRKLTLVSPDQTLLHRGEALMKFNGISNVSFLHSSLDNIPLATDAFDFSWSYERMQVVPDPIRVINELCRVSKAIMVVVPNAYNYGQYPHYFYHRISGTTCDYVGPKHLTRRAPVRDALNRAGMAIIDEGMIDIPWWPLFPELPNLVRRLLGWKAVIVDPAEKPEVNPRVIPPSEIPELRRRVQRAAIIERSSLLPQFIKVLFAHSMYVIGCKPGYRSQLGLGR